MFEREMNIRLFLYSRNDFLQVYFDFLRELGMIISILFFFSLDTMHLTKNVLKIRAYFYVIFGALFAFSIASFFIFNVNYGIDITGGSQTEYSYTSGNIDVAKISSEIQTLKEKVPEINTINVYQVTWEKVFVVETGFQKWGDEKTLEKVKVQFRDDVNATLAKHDGIEMARYTNIGASFGEYIRNTAKLTLLIAIIGIAVYVAYAFSGAVGGIPSLSFGIITVVTLFHDVLIAAGLYLMVSHFYPQYQIDTFFVTALLTILGFSINDTIVVFDRIRANLKLFWGKWKDLAQIINESVSEVFTRSLYTSFTVVMVLFAILIWWPTAIGGFTLTMLFGTIVGTFSSIFIASPLLYDMNKNKKLEVYKKKEYNPDDKIVV